VAPEAALVLLAPAGADALILVLVPNTLGHEELPDATGIVAGLLPQAACSLMEIQARYMGGGSRCCRRARRGGARTSRGRCRPGTCQALACNGQARTAVAAVMEARASAGQRHAHALGPVCRRSPPARLRPARRHEGRERENVRFGGGG
jgi:hypothetical protein